MTDFLSTVQAAGAGGGLRQSTPLPARFLLALGLLVSIQLAGCAPPAAQTPKVMTGTVVVTLGTAGGPRPRVDRSQSANLLIVDGESYLIDFGENAIRRLTQAGVDFLQPHRLFITHAHSDHTLGVPALLATQWEFQEREILQIYGPPGTVSLVNGALSFLEGNTAIRFAEGNPDPISQLVSAHDVQPGEIYRDRQVKVTAIENTHFNFPVGSPAFGKYKAYSYRFETPTRTVVFTGDTGPSQALVELARGADLLVTEVGASEELLALYARTEVWQRKSAIEKRDWLQHQQNEHLSPEAVGELAAAAGVKSVVLTHLTPSGIAKDDYARWAERVRKKFSGEVRVATDLARF